MSPNYVPGIGPFNPDLFIVGEAPGSREDEALMPFVGPTGKMVDELLENAGLKRSEVYLTNVVKYRPPLNDFKSLHLIDIDLQQQIDELWKEIQRFNPKCILCVGDRSLQAVTGLEGILKYRGSILRANDGRKVVATIHPAALFEKPDKGGLPYVYKKLIQHDFIRAAEQSRFREFNLPVRTLSVARNSLDVFRFFQEYKLLDKAANDIESINCIPVCTGFAFNKHHALSIPLLRKIGENQLTDMSEREIAECWKMVQEQFNRLRLLGHNYKYDEFKQRLLGFRNLNCYSDTLLKIHTIFPELPIKSLAVCASLFTEEPFYKEEGKEQKIGKKFDADRFFKYNAKDCAVEYEVDEEMEVRLEQLSEQYHVPLKDFYYNYVMKAHSFFLKLENNGFAVNQDVKAELKSRYEYMQEVVHTRLVEQVGYEVNVKSYPQIFTLLYKAMNFKPFKKEPTSEDSIIRLLGNHCKGKDANLKKKILEDILEERRIRDQISRAINFVEDYDGRCKTSIKITGTETARRSTNILKKPVRPKKIGLAFHTIPKHGRLAKDIRSMLIPDKGFVLIQGDLSQAEARIVAVLAEDWELLKAFDEVDIHRRTAGLFFGYSNTLDLRPIRLPIIDDLEKDGPERFTGKMFRHAGNYDMGKARAMNEFNVNAQKYEINAGISEWKAGQYIDLFHNASPRIRSVFHKGIRDCIDSTRCLINPYGRPREFYGRFDDELYKEGYAQIPQSTVADTTLTAALAADKEIGEKDFPFWLSENHDALVIQAPVDEWEVYARCLKKHMQRNINFSTYCSLRRDIVLTIPVDIEISINKDGKVTNYGELNKASRISPGWENEAA